MFQEFPYTDMHQLNLDWIIKIAKDFLDQYTHIQQIISEGIEDLQTTTTTGLEELQDKADTLEGLLQSWYDTHSADIANQLVQALADLTAALNTALTQFNAQAEAKAQETIESIPADYSSVATDVIQLKKALSVHSNVIKLQNMVVVPETYIDNTTGNEVADSGWTATGYIPLPEDCFFMYRISGSAGSSTFYNCFYDINKNYISNFLTNQDNRVPANARYVRCSQNTDQFNNIILCFVSGADLMLSMKNSITYQGTIESIERQANTSLKVVLKHNPAGNMGYYQPPHGAEFYFNAKGGTQIDSLTYQYTIGPYNALVLDMSELYTSQYGQVQAKVVNYADIKPYHFVLIRNSHDSTGLNITGEMEIDSILNEYVKRRIPNKDIVMKSICRMGDAYGLPESAAAIKKAYAAGYNYIRLNLQFTSNGVAVLWHDPYLNQYYQNVYDASGNLVTYTPENRMKISETAFAVLNQFRYGSATADPGIPTLNAALKAARSVGMHVYLETKMSLSNDNINSLAASIYTRGMMDMVTICTDDFTLATTLSSRLNKLRIGLMSETLTENMKTAFNTIIANGNPVMWWGYRTTVLDNNSMYYIAPKKIDYEVCDFQTLSEVDTYLAQTNALVCSGMEIEGSMTPRIGQYIENTLQ